MDAKAATASPRPGKSRNEDSAHRRERHIRAQIPARGGLPSGGRRIRFRRKGSATITLNAPPGTDEFMKEYLAAFKGNAQPITKQPEGRQRATIGTLRWLTTQYYGSAEFKLLEPHTQHVRRLILDKLCQGTDANGVRRGDKPYAQMEPRNVRALRDEKAETPEAANQIVKMLRQVFAYAVVADLAKTNPAKEVPYLKSGSDGFHTWTIEEVCRFEARAHTHALYRAAPLGHHPVRTPARKERLAEDHAAQEQKSETYYD
jgi:hypothetical protein